MCQTLGLSWTQLQDQPADWIEATLEYLHQKGQYEKAQMEAEKNKGKVRRR